MAVKPDNARARLLNDLFKALIRAEVRRLGIHGEISNAWNPELAASSVAFAISK
jgi:hypothetical protein